MRARSRVWVVPRGARTCRRATDETQRGALEAQIARAADAGDFDAAVTRVIEGYGPEILGFLCATMRSEHDASEAFSLFSEDVWRGMPGFRRESSFRTWSYVLARNAAHRFRRDPFRRRAVGPPESAWVENAAQQVRTGTLSFLRSSARDAIAALRDRLAPDDQVLLILRVDRQMSWDDVAAVVDGGAPADEDARRRRTAALRKQFERAKARLRALAVEAGVLKRRTTGEDAP